MINRINLLVFQSLLMLNCSCQTALNTSLKLNEYIGINDNHVEYITIEYTNDNKNDVLVWVDFSQNEDRNYFFRNRQGDFSLSDLIYERLITDKSMKVGVTFLKILKPSEKLRFHILDSNHFQNNEINVEQFKKCVKSDLLSNILEKYKFDHRSMPSYSGFDVLINY